ncbi:SAM dependent methyltransferase [Diaporthe sp. PMI_573]|nr:SAM dependent methyltransferase [Diaporthaceae sp. PMI_573]
MSSQNSDADAPTDETPQEDTMEDLGSYYAELLPASTQSLSSSVLRYRVENGRTYHAYKDGQYWYDSPTNISSMSHQLNSHTMYLQILGGKLHLAPISDNPQVSVLAGIITATLTFNSMDFADEYPSAEVIGADLSPIQPAFVPPNCHFVVDDINELWSYPDDKFDFVHIRAMTGSVPDWVEFYKTILQMGERTGKTFAASEVAYESTNAAGFINVYEVKFKVSIGPWAKDKRLKEWGIWNMTFLMDGLEGFALRGLTTILGWSVEEVQVYLAGLRKELKDPSIHSYLYL